MSKHSRTTPPDFTKAPQHEPTPIEDSNPALLTLTLAAADVPAGATSRDYIDRAGALRAQHEHTAAVAVQAELSEAAADLLAEFDRDMKAYRDMLVDALGPILPAYIPAVRVGAVSVRDTFGGGK